MHQEEKQPISSRNSRDAFISVFSLCFLYNFITYELQMWENIKDEPTTK